MEIENNFFVENEIKRGKENEKNIYLKNIQKIVKEIKNNKENLSKCIAQLY
jgi:hypothetical protein